MPPDVQELNWHRVGAGIGAGLGASTLCPRVGAGLGCAGYVHA